MRNNMSNFYKGKPLNQYSKIELIKICEELMALIHELSTKSLDEEL